MTKCLSETNGFIFPNPGHSMGSLCSSGPQGFRQLTKHILLLLCCPPTMLFTYRRTSGSVRQMNEIAWLSFTELLHRKSWIETLSMMMPKMLMYIDCSQYQILNSLACHKIQAISWHLCFFSNCGWHHGQQSQRRVLNTPSLWLSN